MDPSTSGSSSSAPPKIHLYYAAVARGSTVLAESTARGVSGNFGLIALRVLENHPPTTLRASYTQQSHLYHVLVSPEDGLTFLTLTDANFNRRVPFSFLADIKTKFTQRYPAQRVQNAIAYEMSGEFEPLLQQRMAYFSTASADTISRVQGDLEDVRQIMLDNIEKVLERGEKIELLVDRTDRLAEESNLFRRQAINARRQMEWQRMKQYALIGGGAAGVVYLLLASFCGLTMSQC